jgi:hypothetical protein
MLGALCSDNLVYLDSSNNLYLIKHSDRSATLVDTNVSKFWKNGDAICVVKMDNSVWLRLISNSFVHIPNMSGLFINKVWLSRYRCFVLKHDGTLHVCGRNTNGEFGDGTETHSLNMFRPVDTIEPYSIQNIWCDEFCTFITKTDEHLYVCGNNSDGRLGAGISRVSIINSSVLNYTQSNLSNIRRVIVSYNTTFALGNSGKLYLTGRSRTIRSPSYTTWFTPVIFSESIVINDFWCVDHFAVDTTIYVLTDTGRLCYFKFNFGEIVTTTTDTPFIINDITYINISNINSLGFANNAISYINNDGHAFYINLTNPDKTPVRFPGDWTQIELNNPDDNIHRSMGMEPRTSDANEITIMPPEVIPPNNNSQNTETNRRSQGRFVTSYRTRNSYRSTQHERSVSYPRSSHTSRPAAQETSRKKTYNLSVGYNTELINTINLLEDKILNIDDSVMFKYNGEIAVDVGGVSRQVFTKICEQLKDIYFTHHNNSDYYMISLSPIFNKYSATIGSILAYYLSKEYSTQIKLSNVIMCGLLSKPFYIREVTSIEAPELLADAYKFKLDLLLETNAQLYLDKYINSIPVALHDRFIMKPSSDKSNKTFYKIVQEILSATGDSARPTIYSNYKDQLEKLFNYEKFVETYLMYKYCMFDMTGNINTNISEFVRGFTNVLTVDQLVRINKENIDKQLVYERNLHPEWDKSFFDEYEIMLHSNNTGLTEYIEGSTMTNATVLSKIIFYDSDTYNDKLVDLLSQYILSLNINKLKQLVYLWSGLRSVNINTRLVVSITHGEEARLPVAHTCFYTLEISNYSTYEILEARMNMFIDNGDTMTLAGGSSGCQSVSPNKYIRRIKRGINVHKNSVKLELFMINHMLCL